jgi:hypothetical protein
MAAILLAIPRPLLAQFSISGTVSDPSSAPVNRVDISLYTSLGDPVGGINPVRTNSAGFYSIGGGNIPPDTYRVALEPPASTGLLPTFILNVVVNSNVMLNGALQFGNRLSGIVRDSLGIGIPDLDLNLEVEPTGQSVFLTSDNTDSVGSYSIIVPSGLFRVIYRAVQGENLVPVELRNVSIANDTTIDVVLRAGFTISGLVTGPGSVAVVGADLDAEDSVTGIKIYTPRDNTDISGHYQLRVHPGTYNINVEPLLPNRLVPEIIFNIPVFSDIILNFNLEAGHLLSGTVRDPGGTPVTDGDIDVIFQVTGIKLFTPSDNLDSTGLYQIIVPSGVFNIDYKPTVVPPYRATLQETSIVITSDIIRNVTVPYGVLLSGSAINSIGGGIQGVDIDAINRLNGRNITLVGDFTDSAGAFATVIAPGLYDIEFEPPTIDHLEAKHLLGKQLNVDTSMVVVLDTAMIVSGIVRDSAGNPFSNVAVIALENVSGIEIFTPGNKTDPAGFYQIAIHPDEYELKYRPDSSTGIIDSVVLQNVNVSSDLTINVQFNTFIGCNYMAGDINGDRIVIGGDVTFGVRFFKGLGVQPPDSCFLDSLHAYLYAAGDVNGNCEFRGSDITRLVAYFKGSSALGYCHFLPPL